MKFKKTLIAGAAATALLGGGVAYATWSATGSGNGSALALTATPVTLNAVASLTPSQASLYPGGPAGTVYFTVSNSNPYAVEITNLSWGTPTSNNPSACASSLISVASGAPTTGFSITIPADGTSAAVSVPGILDLSSSATDACQGEGFSVPITASGQQVP
jgi:hypothetical protein